MSCSACAEQAIDLQHPVACGRMVKVFCFLSTTTLSPSVTMRSASTVDEAVEAACAGDSHGAQTPVSAISRGREGRRRHPGPWTAAVLRSALTALSTFSHGYVRYTRSTSLILSTADRDSYGVQPRYRARRKRNSYLSTPASTSKHAWWLQLCSIVS